MNGRIDNVTVTDCCHGNEIRAHLLQSRGSLSHACRTIERAAAAGHVDRFCMYTGS